MWQYQTIQVGATASKDLDFQWDWQTTQTRIVQLEDRAESLRIQSILALSAIGIVAIGTLFLSAAVVKR